MSQLSDIKDNINAQLEILLREEVIKEIFVDDLRTSIFDRAFSRFPAAILTTPTIENTAFTNSQNIRTYMFEIIFVLNPVDITSSTDVEDLIMSIIDQFDSDPTLKAGGSTGVADGGVEPSSSAPQSVVSRSGSYIAFSVFIRCKKVRDLTFQ